MLGKEEQDRFSWPDVFNHPVIAGPQAVRPNEFSYQQKPST
jgi:hypothetical protein